MSPTRRSIKHELGYFFSLTTFPIHFSGLSTPKNLLPLLPPRLPPRHHVLALPPRLQLRTGLFLMADGIQLGAGMIISPHSRIYFGASPAPSPCTSTPYAQAPRGGGYFGLSHVTEACLRKGGGVFFSVARLVTGSPRCFFLRRRRFDLRRRSCVCV